jgi:hypothetical protein
MADPVDPDDDDGGIHPPSMASMLLDMLHYGASHGSGTTTSLSGIHPPVAHTTTSTGWASTGATPSASTPHAVEVLPGVFVDKTTMPKSTKRARKTTSFLSIQPSLVRLIQNHATRRHGRGGTPTLYSPLSDHFVVGRAINDAIKALSVQIAVCSATGERKTIEGRVPISPVSHNDRQLEFGRTSIRFPDVAVPKCCYGESDRDCSASSVACTADRLPLVHEPLQMYLTPEQQRVFDETGRVPPYNGPCLLCSCRDVMTHILLNANDANPEVQSGRYALCPSFTVPVNQHDGYRIECCAVPSAILNVYVPTMTEGLYVEYLPEKKVWRVNQSAIVWRPTTSTLPLN